jgi:hypothetical protein
MDTKKIVAGTVVWSIGLAVPAFYHALLMHAAVQEDGLIYAYNTMVKYFFELPWVVWPYLIAMTIVGSILVVSGLRAGRRSD